MEQQTFSPELISTRLPKLKMVVIGQHGFLFDKQGLSVRKKILYEKNFKKAEFINGNAVHLDLYQVFNLHGKRLSVSANYFMSYGPLGDRMKFKAIYDGENIGEYSGLRSYMGGGSNGEWPKIIRDDWQLILLFELQQNTQNKLNHFSVNYFESLIPFSKNVDDAYADNKTIREENINLSQLQERFTIDDFIASKTISWEHLIKDENENDFCKLSCFCFPGFQQYRFNRYGKISNWEEHVKNSKPFISRETENSGCLYTLEFQTNNTTEIYFPWECVSITGKYEK